MPHADMKAWPRRGIVVTGGASGIGLATAAHLLAAGWPVALVDRSRAALDLAREGLQALVAHAEFETLDITDEAALCAWLDALEARAWPLGGLVNCAGIGHDATFLATTTELLRTTIEVNLIGNFVVAREVARRLARGSRDPGGPGGSIVNVASVSAIVGNAGRAAYGASKAAIVNLTQVMANELAPRRVRVNCVCPGPIATALAERVHTDAVRAAWHDRVPMRRYGTPEEVAATIRFFIDEALSGYVTGQVLNVDGGFCAAGLQRDAFPHEGHA